MISLYAVIILCSIFKRFKFMKVAYFWLLFLLAISAGRLSASEWDNIYEPPKLNNPIVYRTIAELPRAKMAAYGVLCAGDIYRVRAGTKDVYIDLSGQPPIKYPLLIQTEGNLIARGVTIELEEQPGCGKGMLPNSPVDEYPYSNVKARPPTGRAIGISVKGIAWIEGVNIKFGGQNGDCVVWSAPTNEDIGDYNLSSSYFFVNSRCDGYDGHGSSEIGSALHADLFQNQVGSPGEIYFENVVAVSGNEGIIIHKGARVVGLRNFSYIEDKNDQEGPVSWGPLLATDVPDENLKISNVWHNAPGPSVWGPHTGPQPANWRFVPWNAPRGADIPTHPEITAGVPPVDFAPNEKIGEYYSTPFLVYHSDGSTSLGANTSSASPPSRPNLAVDSVE